jgi:tRNA (adenine58-N1)-methyltransferase non-catalytic subunit
VTETGEIVMRGNRFVVDDSARQKLSSTEIEELKKAGTGSGKEIIAKIMAAHTGIDEKTKFSLAKYTLRKSKKYIKRFTVLPMDVNILTEVFLEKDPSRIMELRPEVLGLITSWANVHHVGNVPDEITRPIIGGGRWLIVDDTPGLIVAAVAEKMGLLYEKDKETRQQELEELWQRTKNDSNIQIDVAAKTAQTTTMLRDLFQIAETNNITVVHPHGHPNISLLKYFGFNPEDSTSTHPLYTNIRSISWLQVVEPESDRSYTEDTGLIPEEELSTWKTSRRGAYFRKRRRWERTRRVVDETREGGFDGLIVATVMKPEGVLKHLVPLVRGGGKVVAYSPTVEPLVELMDSYSKERKSAYVTKWHEATENGENDAMENDPDFPVDPSLLLHPMLQTSRAIEWQALPMRTHPKMTSKGGAEGYVFTATRVLPAAMPVVAKGRFTKKRKKEVSTERDTKRVKDHDTPDSKIT